MYDTVVCQHLTNEYPCKRNHYYIFRTQHELLSCPFCNEESIIVVIDNMTEPTVWAECTQCEAQGPHETIALKHSLIDAAVDGWNERIK